MNYQPAGLFQGMSMEDIMRLYQMIQKRQQQEPMLTGPMMLAQNQVQKMFGGPGDPMSPQHKLQYCKDDPEGVGCERFKGNAPAAPAPGYSQGTNSKVIDDFENRRRIAEALKYNLPPDSSWERINAESLKAFQKKQKMK